MDRKRIMRLATGALLIAMIFFVGRTCQAEHADITVVFVNDGDTALERMEATVLRGQEVVATFSTGRLAAGEKRSWTIELDPGRYELELETVPEAGDGEADAGRVDRVRRRLEAVPRATIRVSLRGDAE